MLRDVCLISQAEFHVSRAYKHAVEDIESSATHHLRGLLVHVIDCQSLWTEALNYGFENPIDLTGSEPSTL